ncbi:MAG: class I SAM-dependent methyltransferase [Acidimicrobiales bacterium]|nr:class I SAM-dependent methyltransferase [Acidimicrobiales bacterium]
MYTRVPRSLIERLKHVPVAYRAALGARRLIGTVRPPRTVPGVPGRVHPNDTMIDGFDATSGQRYTATGEATVDQLLALAQDQLGPGAATARWLELGCGYGRLMRQLVQRVPSERVVGADIDAQGVRFCEAELGVTGIVCDRPPDELELPTADVLFAVSVISHLDADLVDAVLRLVVRTVAPGGIAVLSTHGPSTLAHLEGYGPSWPALHDELAADLACQGWAHRTYTGLGRAYGLTWHDPEFLLARIRTLAGDALADVEVHRRGLEAHQDLYVLRFAPEPRPAT